MENLFSYRDEDGDILVMRDARDCALSVEVESEDGAYSLCVYLPPKETEELVASLLLYLGRFTNAAPVTL